MKAGIAAMLGAMIILARTSFKPNGFLMLALVADEEEHQTGTLRLMERYPEFHQAVVGEPSGLDSVIAHKGDMYVRVESVGQAAHASVPALGVNAIGEMGEFLRSLHDYRSRLAGRSDPLLGFPTISTTSIRGGMSACITPDRGEVVFDHRIVPEEDPGIAWAELRNMVVDHNNLSKACFAAERLWTAPGMCTPGEARIVRELAEACLQVLEKEPDLIAWPAVADSGILASHGIETVLFGPGDIRQAHGSDEKAP